MLIYLFLAISLAVLAVATYTDFRSREVPDFLSYGAIAAGIALHSLESLISGSLLPIALSLAGAALAFASMYVLWRLGAIAGGDVKLLTALAALIPAYPAVAGYPVFFAVVLANGILAAAPYFFAYVAARALVRFRKEFFAKVCGNLKGSAASAVAAVSAFLSLGGGIYGTAASLALAAAASRFWQVALVALPAAALNQGTIATMLLGSLAVSAAYSLVFSVLSMRKKTLRKTVRLGDAEEGMILSESYARSGRKLVPVGMWEILRSKPEIAVHARAAGLEKRDIALLRKHGITEISVKESIPMVPIILLGFAVSLASGDVVIRAFL